ncbi:MAG: PIN domain-containing protein, partial [Gammaproteobacteria bacterium]
MYLLDTNVLSEIVRPNPDGQVMAKLFAQRSSDVFASEITRFELRRGACLRQDTERFWARLQRDVLPVVNWLPLT